MELEKLRIAKELLENMESCESGRDYMSFTAEQIDAIEWLITLAEKRRLHESFRQNDKK